VEHVVEVDVAVGAQYVPQGIRVAEEAGEGARELAVGNGCAWCGGGVSRAGAWEERGRLGGLLGGGVRSVVWSGRWSRLSLASELTVDVLVVCVRGLFVDAEADAGVAEPSLRVDVETLKCADQRV
jgi:hypothetical protein